MPIACLRGRLIAYFDRKDCQLFTSHLLPEVIGPATARLEICTLHTPSYSRLAVEQPTGPGVPRQQRPQSVPNSCDGSTNVRPYYRVYSEFLKIKSSIELVYGTSLLSLGLESLTANIRKNTLAGLEAVYKRFFHIVYSRMSFRCHYPLSCNYSLAE